MASCKDVIKIGKKLEKLSANNTDDKNATLELLKTLTSTPITFDILQKTRIGMTVNNFRKRTTNIEAMNLAKSLIKDWKKIVPGPTESKPSGVRQRVASASSTTCPESQETKTGGRASKSNGRVSSTSEQQSNHDSPSTSTSKTSSVDCLRPDTDVVMVFDTKNPVRNKCRDLLAQAMSAAGSVNVGDFVELAAQVEECIFGEFRNTETKYKNRIRSRIANLKNTANPRLRENVVLGHITPEKFAVMSTEEMASDEMKELREKLTKEAINDHQMGVAGASNSDLFRCGRCGKRNTMYNQIQLLSSDEPMTTFVLCNECGHRWKFS